MDKKHARDYDEDDEDADEELMPSAFAVEGEMSPEDGPPTSGMDYLKRVRWEVKRVPKVVVSNINPRAFDQNQTEYGIPPRCPPPPPGLEPLPEWEAHLVEFFGNLQKQMEKLFQQRTSHDEVPSEFYDTSDLDMPKDNSAKKWHAFCFGKPPQPKETNTSTGEAPKEEEEEEFIEPLLRVILSCDHVTIQFLVNHHIKWLEKEPFTEERAQWLFALLSRLEKPLDPDIAFDLRVLLRKLATLRSKMTDPSDPLLPHLQILITIVAKYFGQQEPD